jgi:S-formylglutathione hydrolase FrmB
MPIRSAFACLFFCLPFAAWGQEFEIRVPAQAGTIHGRVFVAITRDASKAEPRLQTGRLGVPFFGRDVEALAAGRPARIDSSDLGSPVVSLRQIPAGDYFVQAYVCVYSEFRRADGHVLWMHDDQWEGQHCNASPGTWVSGVEKLRLDAAAGYKVVLEAGRQLPPIQVSPDTDYVKRIKFVSPSLTKFWGRPIYLGATVLLPRDYATSGQSYPVIYEQGHFSLTPALNFERDKDLAKAWMGDNFPRLIAVKFQHPTPYFDDSYAVNSPNVGPYGDAILQELIPELEKRFRIIPAGWARALTGGSTGGWEALALQIFHPDFFGGAWSYCPDMVEFSDVEGIDIYKDKNAYYKEYEWRRVPTVNSREVNGQIRQTQEERNRFELVSGTRGRSGEQLDIWQAVFGPVGKDGYFEPLYDKKTGVMNPAVAQYWKENYELKTYLERNWFQVGPKLQGKLRIYTGDADNFFLNNSVRKLEEWIKTTKDPVSDAYFDYGAAKGHCYAGAVSPTERVREIGRHFAERGK